MDKPDVTIVDTGEGGPFQVVISPLNLFDAQTLADEIAATYGFTFDGVSPEEG